MLKYTKRILKLIISLLVFLSDRVTLFNQDKAICVILYYHAVHPEDKNSFASQMDDLLRWTKPIAISEIDPFKSAGHYCAVTFDDGFVCILDNALPELTKRNIPATLFIPSDCLGQHPPWLDEKHVDYKNVVMTQSQLNSLDKNLFSIGSHCRTHRNLLTMHQEEARKEIIQSKKELEDILTIPIDTISFPHGDFNQNHIDMAIQAGYKQAFSIEPKLIYAGSECFVRGRVKTDPSDWRIEFRLKLFGTYRWLPLVFSIKQQINTLLKKVLYSNLALKVVQRNSQ